MSRENLFGGIGRRVAFIGAEMTPGLERAQEAVNFGTAFRDLVEVLWSLPPEDRRVVHDALGIKIAKRKTQPLFDGWNSFPEPQQRVVTEFLEEIQKLLE